MSFCFWLLWVESCNFLQLRKKELISKLNKFTRWQLFHSERQPRTILCENSCHFVNLVSFASSSFSLSMRKIMWLDSQLPKTRRHAEHQSLEKKNIGGPFICLKTYRVSKKTNGNVFLFGSISSLLSFHRISKKLWRANIFESGPTLTPRKFSDGLPLLPKCKLLS